MSPSPGSQLDHYEIIELIGKGGISQASVEKINKMTNEVVVVITSAEA